MLTGKSNSTPPKETVEKPKDENNNGNDKVSRCSGCVNHKRFSNVSQSTDTFTAVPSRKTFQNTANFGKPFQGIRSGNMGQKLCFVCYSPNHLIINCDFHSEYLSKFPKTKSANHKPGENTLVWNHANRVNNSNFSKDYRYPHQKRPFSNRPFQSTGKPSVSQAVPSQSTARPSPNQGTASHFSNVRPRRFNNYRPRRPYTSNRVPKAKDPKQTVKTN